MPEQKPKESNSQTLEKLRQAILRGRGEQLDLAKRLGEKTAKVVQKQSMPTQSDCDLFADLVERA